MASNICARYDCHHPVSAHRAEGMPRTLTNCTRSGCLCQQYVIDARSATAPMLATDKCGMCGKQRIEHVDAAGCRFFTFAELEATARTAGVSIRRTREGDDLNPPKRKTPARRCGARLRVPSNVAGGPPTLYTCQKAPADTHEFTPSGRGPIHQESGTIRTKGTSDVQKYMIQWYNSGPETWRAET